MELLWPEKKYGKAAERGDAEAQWQLGQMYYRGKYVDEDLPKSRTWLERAAAQNHCYAQYLLGILYRYGRGVENANQSAKWLSYAAVQGHADAKNLLGELYNFESLDRQELKIAIRRRWWEDTDHPGPYYQWIEYWAKRGYDTVAFKEGFSFSSRGTTFDFPMPRYDITKKKLAEMLVLAKENGDTDKVINTLRDFAARSGTARRYIPTVLPFSTNKDPAVRIEAIIALSAISKLHGDVLTALMHRCVDRNRLVRYEVYNQISKHRGFENCFFNNYILPEHKKIKGIENSLLEVICSQKLPLHSLAPSATAVLIMIGKYYIPSLVKAISPRNMDKSFAAISILSHVLDPNSARRYRSILVKKADFLIALLKGKRNHTALITVLGYIGRPVEKIVPLLVAGLEKKNNYVETAALIRVGKKAVPYLLKASECGRWPVRRGAILALGKIATQLDKVLPIINKAFNDRAIRVRYAANHATATLGQKAYPILDGLIENIQRRDLREYQFILENQNDRRLRHFKKNRVFRHSPDIARIIVNLGEEEVIEPILEILKKNHFNTHCIQVLSYLGAKASSAIPLLQIIIDNRGLAWRNAASALFNIDLHNQLPHYCSVLEDKYIGISLTKELLDYLPLIKTSVEVQKAVDAVFANPKLGQHFRSIAGKYVAEHNPALWIKTAAKIHYTEQYTYWVPRPIPKYPIESR